MWYVIQTTTGKEEELTAVIKKRLPDTLFHACFFMQRKHLKRLGGDVYKRQLLEKAGLIECDPSKGFTPTKADITNYKVKIDIKEAESATLANLLPDCAAAIINGGNAYTAGLDPTADTIFQEDVNPETNEAVSQLVNVIVARTADKDNEVYQKVVAAYQTPEVEKTIQDAYKGAFICAWEGAGEEK